MVASYEKFFTHSYYDIVFPFHMMASIFMEKSLVVESREDGIVLTENNYSPKKDLEEYLRHGIALVPFKVYNRRRSFLVWAHSHRFDTFFTDDEKNVLKRAE